MNRLIIIGLSNPHSDLAEEALAPFPERSSGWRLAKMASDACNVDFVTYMHQTDRRNLLKHDQIGKENTSARAKISARWMLKFQIPKDSEVVLLGHDVFEAFSPHLSKPLERTLIHPQVIDGITWRWLPHPSGRSRHYNDPSMRALAGMLIGDAITAQQHRRTT